MKIYINNFNLDILPSIQPILINYLIKEEPITEIYSNIGMFQITDKHINSICNIQDVNIQICNNYFEEFTLIVDPSYYTLEKVNSIPPQHIANKIIKSIYKLNHTSSIRLIIESPINNIYFETDTTIDVSDKLFKKELIEFLSLLN